ncbi:MAG: hypothetical protein OI717_00130 (plasmid) [Candidatus Methanoperedens sp.]|nr:MAG: hypothetical protein OI717_00130 [Candidatus Methanoperedens sp.]
MEIRNELQYAEKTLTIEEFLQKVKNLSHNLKTGKSKSKDILRDFERKDLILYDLFSKWDNKENSKELFFAAYFLKTIIKDIWRNLLVDVSYEIPDEDLDRLFESIGISFSEFKEISDDKNFAKFYLGLSSILYEYYSLLRLREQIQLKDNIDENH